MPKLAADNRGEPAPVNRKRRFHLLYDACPHLPEVRQRLIFAWMADGLSRECGLAATDNWKGAIPSGALCIQGNASASNRPNRIRHCRIGGADYWFVYTRERQQKKAEAVFTAKPPAPPHA